MIPDPEGVNVRRLDVYPRADERSSYESERTTVFARYEWAATETTKLLHSSSPKNEPFLTPRNSRKEDLLP